LLGNPEFFVTPTMDLHDRERLRKLGVLLGILVVALFAFIQAVHMHPESSPADSHCAICAAAHAPALAAAPVLLSTPRFTGNRVLIFQAQECGLISLAPFYGRPPPPIA
jgi:hypothetical protein